jgi:hypothetical protein
MSPARSLRKQARPIACESRAIQVVAAGENATGRQGDRLLIAWLVGDDGLEPPTSSV